MPFSLLVMDCFLLSLLHVGSIFLQKILNIIVEKYIYQYLKHLSTKRAKEKLWSSFR